MALGAFLLIYLIFSLAGIYPTYRLLSPSSRRYLLLLAPQIGIALMLSIVGLSHGFGLASKYGGSIAIAILFFFPIFNWRKIYPEITFLNLKKDYDIFAALSFAIFCGFILIKPLLDRHLLSWFGGGSDSLGYINGASYLLDHSYPHDYFLDHLDEFQPWKGWIFHILHFDFLGNFFNLSAISNIIGMDPVKLFNPLMATYGSLTVLGIFLLARIGLQLNSKVSILSCGLLSLHTYWMMPHYTTFLNQAAGLALTTTSLALIPRHLKIENTKREAILLGFLIGALIAFYSIFLSFIILTSLLFIILNFTQVRSNLRLFLQRNLLVLIGIICVNNFFLKQNFSRGFAVGTDALYTPLSYFQNWPHFITFFTNYMPPHYNWGQISSFSQIKDIVLALISCVLFMGSFYILKKAQRKFFISLITGCIILCLIAWFKGNGYGLWKILTFSQIIYVLGFSIGSALIWSGFIKFSQRKKITLLSLSLIILISHLDSARILTLNPFYELSKEIAELEQWAPSIKKELNSNEALKIEIPEPYSIYEWLSVLYTLRELPLHISNDSKIHKELFYGPFEKRNTILTPLKLVKISENLKTEFCLFKNKDYCVLKSY